MCNQIQCLCCTELTNGSPALIVTLPLKMSRSRWEDTVPSSASLVDRKLTPLLLNGILTLSVNNSVLICV